MNGNPERTAESQRIGFWKARPIFISSPVTRGVIINKAVVWREGETHVLAKK